MKARKQLLAAGSTVTLVAGGIFLGAAPAFAAHDSPECLSAQDQFTAALHAADLNATLEVELAVALQNLLNAQATLDLLDVEGALTLDEINAQIVAELDELRTPQLPALQAIINAEGNAGSAVGEAQLLLDAVLAGQDEDAAALLDLGINLEDFLLDPEVDVAALTVALEAAVTAGDLDADEADAILLDLSADGVLDASSLDLLVDANIVLGDYLLEAEVDVAALEGALIDLIADLNLTIDDAAAAAVLLDVLQNGDLAAIIAAEAQLEALLGVDLDLSALVGLQAQLLERLAIQDAEADLAAALAAVDGLLVQLEALDVDLLELEALFDAAIEACAGAGVGAGGGSGDDDSDNAGADGGGAGTGTAVTVGTGGTNRGMNVQTAVPTADTDPAGIGALAAGIGFLVVAGAVTARRVRNS